MKNGCYNRAPLNTEVRVQVGWSSTPESRLPRMKDIPDQMTKSCVYQINTKNDPKCQGCVWLTLA